MDGRTPRIDLPRERIAEFCRRHHIRRLSLFGSVLRDDFRPDSDVDVLVEYDPAHIPGLIRLAGHENELSDLIGRKADLNTSGTLGRHYRQETAAEALPVYDEAR